MCNSAAEHTFCIGYARVHETTGGEAIMDRRTEHTGTRRLRPYCELRACVLRCDLRVGVRVF